MKKTIFTLSVLCLFTLGSFAQTIRRVTDRPNVTGVNIYTTIQAAHNASSNGDIIYVEPKLSSGDYGTLTCSKQLTIIGNGFADVNNNYLTTPNPPQNQNRSKIYSFTLNNGSQGTVIRGLEINCLGCSVNSYINVPNITIDRCRFLGGNPTLAFGNSSATIRSTNITVTRCYFGGNMGVSNFNGIGFDALNCTLTNNIFYTGGGGAIGFYTSNISNNIFAGNAFVDGEFCTVYNNIFAYTGTAVSQSLGGSPNNSISKNISVAAAGLPTGNGNINGAILANIFINGSPSSNSPDSDWQLTGGSPAIGTGIGGVDMGVFAGSNPWVLSSLPPVPIITQFTTTGAGNSTTPLSVSVSVRGNN